MQLLSQVFSVKMLYRQLITTTLSIYKNFSLGLLCKALHNKPGGFVRQWMKITLLPPTRWEVNTSGGRGWSRAVRKRIDCTPWRQSGAMLMPSTSLEGCIRIVSGQRLIWKTPSGGMPKHTQDFSLWRRLWQTISSAIALVP